MLDRRGIREENRVKLAAYIDWRNNYLTVECYADHNGLDDDVAKALIEEGRKIAYTFDWHLGTDGVMYIIYPFDKN